MGPGAFFAFMLYQNISVKFTLEIPIAAVDGRALLINPIRFPQLTVGERVFVLAHEIMHIILRHVARFKTIDRAGGIGGAPFNWQIANFSADYIINRILVNGSIGSYNKNWLLRPDLDDPKYAKAPERAEKDGAVGTNEAFEDVYLRELKKNPPPNQPQAGDGDPGDDEGEGEGQGKGEGAPGKFSKPMPGSRGKPNATNDGTPDGAQGSFDYIILPPIEQDGASDAASDARAEQEMRRAVEAAKSFAKAIGSLPGSLESFLDKFLEGKVDWRKQLRLSLTKRTGASTRTWSRPDRRQLALRNQYWPAKADFGCDSIAAVIDTSGSVSDEELRVFLGELSKILQDLRPRSVHLIWCDAAVGRIDEVTNIAGLKSVAAQRGIPGRGGTNMCPGLDAIREMRRKPVATLVLTDGFVPWPTPGSYKELKPLWCMTHAQDNFPDGIGEKLVLDLKAYVSAD
jgi:predicted metal-dependent peptidase